MSDKIEWKKLFSEAKGSEEKKLAFIRESQKHLKTLIEKGYRHTPDGYLSPRDIARGGYIWREEEQVYVLPAIDRFADGFTLVVVTEQYMTFKQELLARRDGQRTAEIQVESLAQSNLTGFFLPSQEIINNNE